MPDQPTPADPVPTSGPVTVDQLEPFFSPEGLPYLREAKAMFLLAQSMGQNQAMAQRIQELEEGNHAPQQPSEAPAPTKRTTPRKKAPPKRK